MRKHKKYDEKIGMRKQENSWNRQQIYIMSVSGKEYKYT